MKKLFILLCIAASAGCAGAPISNQATSVAAARPAAAAPPACYDDAAVAQTVERVVASEANVGLSIAIAHNGQIVNSFVFGFADLEDSARVTRRSRFPTASVTKAVTGVALLQAVERGEVDLDVPIQRYVPEFPVKKGGAITLRLLAAQLSGVRHWGNERTPALFARHFENVDSILPLFANDTLVVPPDSEYSYSSLGYNLIAIALQRASGRPFQELVRKHIIEPLSLKSTDFNDVRAILPHRVDNYSYFDLSRMFDGVLMPEIATPMRVPVWDYSHNMAGGNIISTAEDLVRFGNAMLKPGLLSAPSLKAAMTRSQKTKVVSPMSFGWFVADSTVPVRRIHINGSNPGVGAALYVYPDDGVVVSILSNTWGKNARAGVLAGSRADQLPSQLAKLCGVKVD